MHELSIAMSLVEAVEAKRRELGGVRVETVHVRLGALSGVVKAALLSAFELAVQGTGIDGARLEIEDVPVTVFCESCQAERQLISLRLRCPVCGMLTGRVVRGKELELHALEVSEHEPAHR